MRHHYIPQFFLHAWAEKNADKKVEVFRLDMMKLCSTRHTPRHTGYEHDLYDLSRHEVVGLKKQVLEAQFFKVLDQKASLVHRKFVQNNDRKLAREERITWTRFLMSLRIRQPDIVGRLRDESAAEFLQSLDDDPSEYEAFAGDTDPPRFSEWTEKHYPGLIENVGVPILTHLINDPEVGTRILRMHWVVWDFAKINKELLIADRPCIFTEEIESANCVIILPISPNKIFLATPNDKILRRMQQGGERRLMNAVNELSFSQARIRIYSWDDSVRRFIQNRLHRRPKREADSL